MMCLKVCAVLVALIANVLCQNYFGNSFNNKNNRYEQNFAQAQQPSFGTSGVCPQPNGTFPTGTCDGYIECKNGVAEEKTCPDGLLFNAAIGPRGYPCQYPIDVDCTGREQTQQPQPTEECPHQFGYYRMGDAQNCGQFKNCVDGRGFVFDCPEGLAFNDETYRCDWPDQVKTCDPEAFLGFSCPPGDARDFGFSQGEYRYFKSPSDCQRYFICIEGKPRLYNCGESRAFNDLINQCDGVENVTGCSSSQYQDDYRKQAPTKLSSFNSNSNRYNRFK